MTTLVQILCICASISSSCYVGILCPCVWRKFNVSLRRHRAAEIRLCDKPPSLPNPCGQDCCMGRMGLDVSTKPVG